MTSQTPPPEVVKAFLDGVTEHTRRVEIYEPDGTTPWSPGPALRVLDGSVSATGSGEERRTLELTLDNHDYSLAMVPGGLWYDKVVKVFRGVRLKQAGREPIIGLSLPPATEMPGLGDALQRALSAIGYGNTRLIPFEETVPQRFARAQECDMIVALVVDEYDLPGVGQKLSEFAYSTVQYGIPTFSMGIHNVTFFPAGTFPGATYATATYTFSASVNKLGTAHPASQGWASFPLPPIASVLYNFARVKTSSNPTPWTRLAMLGDFDALLVREGIGIRWAAYALPVFGTEVAYENADLRMMMLAVMNWLNPLEGATEWETQIGEFMIDRLSAKNYPRAISITGRDYTKKCLGSKYAFATQFSGGGQLEAIIASIAGAAGITKRLLPITGISVAKSFFFDRGVTRWDAMQEIARAYDYEVYFDAQGYLVLAPIPDPATAAPNFWLKVGGGGSLVSFTKSTSDTRMYNVIVVTGESSDTDTLPVYAVARNDDPGSATSTVNIGERVYQYTSSWITTTPQAQNVANSFLGVHALEEFAVSFESLMLPWLDVGDIIGFEDPDPNDDAPERLLLSDLTIPLKVGSMSGSGKRVVAF